MFANSLWFGTEHLQVQIIISSFTRDFQFFPLIPPHRKMIAQRVNRGVRGVFSTLQSTVFEVRLQQAAGTHGED